MRILLVIYLLVQGVVVLYANDNAEKFAQALQWQEQKNWTKAIEAYEALAAEHEAAAVYNNLGLVYAETNQIGKAILNFERALLLDSDEEIEHNLKAAQQRIVYQVEAVQPLFFVRWWRAVVASMSSTAWAVLFLLFFAAGVAGLAAKRWFGEQVYQNIGVGLLAFSLLLLFWGGLQKSNEMDDSTAIVIAAEVGLRQEATLSSPEIEVISGGVKVRILKEQESWVYVQLPNHLLGWMPLKMLERIQ